MPGKIQAIVNSRFFLWFVLSLPLAWMANAFWDGDLFYGEIIHASGEFSARLLILTMAITPLRLMFVNAGWPNWLLHRRRYFGVASFAYAVLHTVVYLDRKNDLELILQEAAEFSMWSGWFALAVFVALALTSNDVSVRRMRRRWKKLHRWIYPAALMTFMHWIFVAFDFVPGLIHFTVIVVLEGYRLWKRRSLKRAGQRIETG